MEFLPEVKLEVIVDEKTKDIAHPEKYHWVWVCCSIREPIEPPER